MNTADAFQSEPLTWEAAFRFAANEATLACDAAIAGDYPLSTVLNQSALAANELARELHDRMFR